MPQIHLTGHSKPIKISKEEAEKLKDIKNDPSIPDGKVIDTDNLNAQKKELGAIVSEGGSAPQDDSTKVQNMTTEELKEKLGDFRKMYEEHKSDELKGYNGLGVMDTGIHRWLDEKGVINKNGDRWGVNPEDYRWFVNRKEMLEEYWGRKDYAEQMEEKEKEQIKQKVQKVKSNSKI